MKRSLIAFAVVLAVFAGVVAASAARRRFAAAAAPGSTGGYDRAVVVAGVEHRFHVYLPPSYRGTPTPLLLFFHGGGGNAENAEKTMQLRPAAGRHGFILVEPEGFDAGGRGLRTWNAGTCCGPSVTQEIDHVAATRSILDAVAAEWAVDRNRVYASGHSNGGMMAYRLAIELSDRIAAIAPNSAYLMASGKPPRPVPVMHMHGLADSCAPFAGGIVDRSLDPAPRPSVMESVQAFVANNGCKPVPVTTYRRGTATCVTYRGCREDADVVLCAIAGGGHAWPGASRYSVATKMKCGGSLTNDLVAGDAIFDFFLAHPMPRPIAR